MAEDDSSVSASISEKPTSILYQDSSQNIFILDIPASINIAQCKYGSEQEGRAHHLRILSSTPPQEPYDSRNEPKSIQARNKILKNIPIEEQRYRGIIDPVVREALEHLNENHDGPWCLPRLEKRMAGISGSDENGDQKLNEDGQLQTNEKKRKYTGDEMESLLAESFRNDLDDPLAHDADHHDSGRFSTRSATAITLSDVTTRFESVDEMKSRVLQNPSSSPCKIRVWQDIKKPVDERQNRFLRKNSDPPPSTIWINVPPESAFIWFSIQPNPILTPEGNPLIHILSRSQKFNLIMADPPWSNRSVKRSAHYGTGLSFDELRSFLESVITHGLQRQDGIVGIWTTNKAESRDVVRNTFREKGLYVCEEWIWVKTTAKGQAVMDLEGVWRKPYEVLIWGRNDGNRNPPTGMEPRRRVIAAVPDLHSRKPNLKELIEKCFYTSEPLRANSQNRGSYMSPVGRAAADEYGVRKHRALELFARNLTAGWWSCGNEVLRFNWEGWWASHSR